MKKLEYRPYLYGAYGSNLHEKQMLARCPMAVKVGDIMLHDYKLIFRGVADIVPSEGGDNMVPIGLWQITEFCEAALDRYEGFPHLYDKHFIPCQNKAGSFDLMVYRMVNTSVIYPPSEWYLQSLITGYQDFCFDNYFLKDAVTSSYLEETA